MKAYLLAATAAMFAAAPAAASVTDGFEDGTLAPWFQDNDFGAGVDWAVTTSDAHTGMYSAMDIGNKELRLNFTAISVADITSATFWLKHPSGAGLPSYVTTFYTDGSSNGGIFTTAGTDWEQIDFSSLLQAGKSLNAFSLYGYSGGASPNATYFDDFSIVSSGGGVPEPATWALMILGMGAVGGAMRRRQVSRASVRFA